MRRVASSLTPLILVDQRSKKPLHRQIYEAYRAAILNRHVHPGQQIPSTRGLTSELGISRLPILNAYSQLLAEGYLEARPGAGTFVSSTLPEHSTTIQHAGISANKSSSGHRPVSRRSSVLPRYNLPPRIFGRGAFSVGQIPTEEFPFRIWSKLIMRCTRNVQTAALHYSDPMGSETFRETIADYLRTSRGVVCDARQILIVSGSQQALEIASRVLTDSGDDVWIEEPGYPLAWQVFKMAGCRLIPVPVDEEGLNVSAGHRRSRKARVVYTTPSHQYPLGVTMSASRRLQLLDWAQRSGSWIIEDDYDSEYRYDNKPIASLQGLDRHARVVYVGTFSKTLFPSLRVGYLVVPLDLLERFVAVRHAMDIFPSQLYQAVLTDFIQEGHYARHIRRTRLTYCERRNALVDALRHECPEVKVLGEDGGMHLVATLPKGIHDGQISERASLEKLWLWRLSPCYLDRTRSRQGFILGFGSTTAHEIPKAVHRLRSLIKSR
jgi:GntR family transcriptional regulator/MocR family aminotransferase